MSQPILEMKVMYRRLSQQRFDDAQAFQTAFMKAEPQVTIFTYGDPAALRGSAGVTDTAKEPAQ
jgi:hypothetical protein